MSPALRYHLQTIGALWVGAASLLFAMREAPFARYTLEEGESVDVVLTGKAFQDLSGAGEAMERGDFLVTFRAAEAGEGGGREYRGRIAYDHHEATEVGAVLAARRFGSKVLLEDDPRWGMRAERALWAWGLAAAAFLAEGVRRVCFGKFSVRTRLAARGSGAGAAPAGRPPGRTPSEAQPGDRSDRLG